LIEFPIQLSEKTIQNLVQSGRKAVSKFELPETQFEGQSETSETEKSLVKAI